MGFGKLRVHGIKTMILVFLLLQDASQPFHRILLQAWKGVFSFTFASESILASLSLATLCLLGDDGFLDSGESYKPTLNPKLFLRL